ncbi:MAG TPA: S41 family peptidase [Candidatus Mediterraneibacter stercorigallinarum]|uniref:S41 family peptidase n=1 Tax=Candidatus Mediterraneibacter stercorigallinarum TaxID=2838686 RepID=A0A9D2DBJ0_9FIRM|nr:S41 family peptidase [Candidatus Mediterraneibacter stercorigallinarum]
MDWEKEKKVRTKRFWLGVFAGFLAAVFLLAGAWSVWQLSGLGNNGDFASNSISEEDVEDKLDQINGLIENYYLYEDEIDEDALIDGIYSGYASALGDPYTEYYDKEETQALLETTSGEFSGIGATMSMGVDSGEITIVNVYKDSPADKAGLQEGDILYQVDDKETAGEDLDTVVSWIKGEQGTDVTLHVLRNGEEIEATATRDIIEIQTVDYEMKDGQIGYIAVSEFDDVTYEQFKTALDDLEAQGMQGLVIDLRGNPGGNLSTVTDMLKLLLPEGTIVSTKDKYGNTEEITCDGSNEFTKPLAVLVNQYSASASEIFSGAIQDYGIGQIVGMTTYGKGVVQQLMDLGDGTYLKITIAEYYTPSGRSINGVGVEPDVEVEYEYDSENPEADNQLDRALEVVQGEISG